MREESMAINGASRPGPTRDSRVDALPRRCSSGREPPWRWRAADAGCPPDEEGNQLQSMDINGNPSQSIDCMHAASGDAHDGGELVAINGNQWQSMAINGNQWQSMAIKGGCPR